jgi:hypothetical protein
VPPLGVLFLFLAACFAGLALAAGNAHQWVVAGAALALAAWLGSLALGVLRRRR